MSVLGNQKYFLHRYVWNNDHSALKKFLSENKDCDIDFKDCRGRTALHLAVVLGHVESARVLLESGASACAENATCWTVTQEAVSRGDPELIQLCLQYRDHQRFVERCKTIPQLLASLKRSDDFYVEMKWEFTSWVPLVSRMCPSDTYRVWKSVHLLNCLTQMEPSDELREQLKGSKVRIDTTLLDFENMRWQRGSRSYIFIGNEDRGTTLLEVDHDSYQVYSDTVRCDVPPPSVSYMCPTDDAVAARLTTPLTTTYIDTDRVSFERSRSGVWGWRSDKCDNVDGYYCKVCSASNVHLVTRTRTEHLCDLDKRRGVKSNTSTPLQSFLGVAELGGGSGKPNNKSSSSSVPAGSKNKESGTSSSAPTSPLKTKKSAASSCSVSVEEYFDESCSLEGRWLGRPVEETVKVHKLKARLWLCDNYPLSLSDQILPLIDLMASSNAHFRRLRDFITLRLLSGFPIKIEIPLYHILNARVTFGNVNGVDRKIEGVKGVDEVKGEVTRVVGCTINPSVFNIPSHYSIIGDTGDVRISTNNRSSNWVSRSSSGGNWVTAAGRCDTAARPSAAATGGGGANNRQYMDDMEDVAVDLALRRSFIESQAGLDPAYCEAVYTKYQEYDTHTDYQTDTAGSAAGLTKRRRSRFSTTHNVSDEDRLIQWALEESLMSSDSGESDVNHANAASGLVSSSHDSSYYLSQSRPRRIVSDSDADQSYSCTRINGRCDSSSTTTNESSDKSYHISSPIGSTSPVNHSHLVQSKSCPPIPPAPKSCLTDDERLRLVIELSAREQRKRQEQRMNEEKELARIMQLSLVDK